MACYKPVKAWIITGTRSDTGHKVLKFKEPIGIPTEEIKIPCGSCIGCRMDYSRMWMGRIVKEASLYPNNAFITLTYNNENLPIKDSINTETGELITGHPLVKKHLQGFIKRLRREYDYHFKHTGIRFYACGEYGGKTMRPHYHLAVFNINTTAWGDIKFHNNNFNGDATWTSQKIEDIWGKGFCLIGDLTPQSAAYIARYMLKKQKGPTKKWYYESKGIISEYTSMSVKPGIAKDWYEQHKDEYWINDRVLIPQRHKAPMITKTPAYFDKQLETEKGIEEMERIKEKRKTTAEKQERIKSSKTTLNEYEQRKVAETTKEASIKRLIRPLE